MAHKNNRAGSKGAKTMNTPGGTKKILFVANTYGDYRELEALIKTHKPGAVVHVGNFGFLDRGSLSRMTPRVILDLIQSSTLLSSERKELLLSYPAELLKRELKLEDLTQYPSLLNQSKKFSVPVYAIYGNLDDVTVLDALLDKKIPNLYLVHHNEAPLIQCGDLPIRLLGLGGSFLRNKLFDHGLGASIFAGGDEGAWSTMLQMGSLVALARQHETPGEVRILLTQGNPANDVALAQLAATIKADYTFSPNSHARHRTTSAYSFSSIYHLPHPFHERLRHSSANFQTLYTAVKPHFVNHLEGEGLKLANLAECIFQYLPPSDNSGLVSQDELFNNVINHSLCYVNHGWVLLVGNGADIKTEVISKGISFDNRLFDKSVITSQDKEGDSPAVGDNKVDWIRPDQSDQSPAMITQALTNGISQLPDPNNEEPVSPVSEPESLSAPKPMIISSEGRGGLVGGEFVEIHPEEDSNQHEQNEGTIKGGRWSAPASEPGLPDNELNMRSNSQPTSFIPSDSELDHEFNTTSGKQLPNTAPWTDEAESPTRHQIHEKQRSPSVQSDQGENDNSDPFANQWNIEVVELGQQNRLPTVYTNAYDRMIFLHPQVEYDPLEIINDVLYDVQYDVARIYVRKHLAYIDVEVKEERLRDEIGRKLHGRPFKGGRIKASPKRKPGAHGSNYSNSNNNSYRGGERGAAYRNHHSSSRGNGSNEYLRGGYSHRHTPIAHGPASGGGGGYQSNSRSGARGDCNSRNGSDRANNSKNLRPDSRNDGYSGEPGLTHSRSNAASRLSNSSGHRYN